jgi:UDP-glucose 4-epimerase
MRALVTGGAGFIGSNLVDVLVARGDDVLVVDHLSRPKTNLDGARERGVQVVRADVTDGAALAEAFRPVRPEVV